MLISTYWRPVHSPINPKSPHGRQSPCNSHLSYSHGVFIDHAFLHGLACSLSLDCKPSSPHLLSGTTEAGLSFDSPQFYDSLSKQDVQLCSGYTRLEVGSKAGVQVTENKIVFGCSGCFHNYTGGVDLSVFVPCLGSINLEACL